MHIFGAKAGEVERLYCEHGSALVLFAAAMTGERSRAQDAVHQVFLKLIEYGTLRQIVDVKAYLFACVRNAVLNEAKARQRNVELDPESLPQQAKPGPAGDPWFNPLNRDRAAELDLQRALRALPADQRQIIVMHIWGGLTFSQIGDVVGASSNTVASRYRYALAKLREAMCAKEACHVNSRG
jgi:RNA polymerase sigma-70 factor (ECF subfamily)